MWIAMGYLLHHARQELIVPLEPRTHLVKVIEHIVLKQMLQDCRLASNGCWNFFAHDRDHLYVEITQMLTS